MSEWGFVNLGKEAQNIDIAEPLEPYSGVRLIVGVDDTGDPLVYISGSESGRVLEVENPFGTQAMANAIFESVRGYSYQPLYADMALLNPAAEIGDAVSVNGVYSGIYTRSTTYGRLMASDISAPTNEEVIHEFNIPTPEERKFQRLNYDMQSQFKLTNNEIEAKVSKTSPQGQSSFGWNLQNNQWTVFNQSGNILKATASGLEVTGKIQADEGYIGGENGFVIKASAIYNGITELNGQGERGVYLGTDGLQIGQGFIADSYGNVKASNMRLIGGSIEIGVEAPVIDPIVKDGFTFYQWAFEQNSFSEPYFVLNQEESPFETEMTVSRILMDNIYELPQSAYTVDNLRVTLSAVWLSEQTVGQHTFEIIGSVTTPFEYDFDVISPSMRISQEVQRTFFRVDSSGNVTASSLNITGGTISIGNNFSVTAEGDLYANSGTFKGAVYAGKVEYGDVAGYLPGGFTDDWGDYIGAIDPGTVGVPSVDQFINEYLGDAVYAAGACQGIERCGILDCVGITYSGQPTGVVSFTVNGTLYNCIGWTSSPA